MKEIKIMMNMEKINNEALENVVGGIFVSKNTGHGVYAYDKLENEMDGLYVAMAPMFPRKKDPLFPSMPELGRRI
jgi:hypothetical protein